MLGAEAASAGWPWGGVTAAWGEIDRGCPGKRDPPVGGVLLELKAVLSM